MLKLKLQKSETRKGVLTLLIDEDPWRDLHTSIYGKRPTLPKSISLEDFQEQFTQYEFQRAKVYVYNRLAARSMHSRELEKMLKERLVSSECIGRLLDECRSMGYLNDREWVENAIRTEMSRKKGPKAILQKLRMKGIAVEEIEAILSEMDSEEGQKERLRKLLETKYRNRDLEDYREREKVIGALVRKGYDFQIIREVL